jgi:dTDP-4-dehydrorhamnose 3,5-epimerase-like enzyme
MISNWEPQKNNEKLNLNVGESLLIKLPFVSDIRGNLSFAEYEKHIPFIVRRCFWIYGVPTKEVRGEHAHKKLKQFLICVSGSVNVILDDGENKIEVILNNADKGLYIPPLIWSVQYKYLPASVLFVLASDEYEEDDYLRNYDQFQNYIKIRE